MDEEERNNAPGSHPLKGMNPHRHLQLVVRDGQRIPGVVTLDDVLRRLERTSVTPEHIHCDHGGNNDYRHAWVPIPEHMGQYRCTLCKKIGRREFYGHHAGEIVIRKSSLPKLVDPLHVSSRALNHGSSRNGKRGPGGW